jgi:hypothetical protein
LFGLEAVDEFFSTRGAEVANYNLSVEIMDARIALGV